MLSSQKLLFLGLALAALAQARSGIEYEEVSQYILGLVDVTHNRQLIGSAQSGRERETADSRIHSTHVASHHWYCPVWHLGCSDVVSLVPHGPTTLLADRHNWNDYE